LLSKNSSACSTKFCRVENVDDGDYASEAKLELSTSPAKLAPTPLNSISSNHADLPLNDESERKSRGKSVRLLDLVRRVRIHTPPVEVKPPSTSDGPYSPIVVGGVSSGEESTVLGIENGGKGQISVPESNLDQMNETSSNSLSTSAGSYNRTPGRSALPFWTCCSCFSSGMTAFVDQCDGCGHSRCTDCNTYVLNYPGSRF
jgi:hypothetical protein